MPSPDANEVLTYENKIKELEGLIEFKTKTYDRIEFERAQQTRKVIELKAALQMAIDDLNASNSALAKVKLELESKNDMWTRIIKLDDKLSNFITEERAAKRARAD